MPEQQRAIEQMRQLREDGLTVRAIAARLTADGVPVSYQAVHKILAAPGT